MKKFFIAMLAVAAVTACAKDEAISLNQESIDFGAPFVENAVRADYSDGKNLTAFTVYGTVTGNNNTVALFGGDGANVTGKVGDATWACGETEYWVPSCTYAFQAVADGVIDNGEIEFEVTDGNLDLIYATATAKTDGTAKPISGVNDNGVVVFTFEHLLSKVGFTFTNTTGGKYSYDVTSVSFVDYNKVGTYTIGGDTNADGKDDGSWGSYTIEPTTALSFGAPGVVASTTPVSAPTTHQIIPGEQTLKVTINYVIRYNGTEISATSIAEKPLTYTFEKGKSYNIAVTIPAPGGEIKFTTEKVGEWTPNTGGDLDLN